MVGSLRDRKDEQRFERGVVYNRDWGLVFTRLDGGPLHTSTVMKRFQRLLAEGVPMKVVQGLPRPYA